MCFVFSQIHTLEMSLHQNIGYFWNLVCTSDYLLVLKELEKIEQCGHNGQKYQDISLLVGLRLLNIFVFSQIHTLEMSLHQNIGYFGIYTFQTICWY